MKAGLAIGAKATFRHRIGAQHMVPNLYPEAASFRAMPQVFATGYMVGLMEWACIEHLAPYYDEGEGSLGTHVDVSHLSPTPPGRVVTVDSEVLAVEGRRVWFSVSAHDGVDLIGAGRHERAVVSWEKFLPRVAAKAVEVS